MISYELDPNLVRPGWTALIIVILLAVIMVGLFISMRRQMKKIDLPPAADEGAEPSDGSTGSTPSVVAERQPDQGAAEEKPRQTDGAG